MNILNITITFVMIGMSLYYGFLIIQQNRHESKTKNRYLQKGRDEGFNLAYFALQEIILNAFQTRGFGKESAYDIFKQIMTESDVVLGRFYPEVQFPKIKEVLEKVEKDLTSKKPVFPNSGNRTIN